MAKYRDNPDAIRALLRETEVHRDLFIDQELFELEMERLYANTWVYVGHDSQVPNPGDYITTTVGNQPVVMVRHGDRSVRVLHNRCPHKGTMVPARPAAIPASSSAAPITPGPSRPTAACCPSR